ncbi:MAG: FtsX-like permease family protein [Chloroflexota bacterium]
MLAGLLAYGLLGQPDIFAALGVMVVGQAALLGAAVLLLPGLIEPLTRLARPLLERWLGTAGRLAADNLSRNKLRAVLTAGALTAGLTIIVATGGLMTAGLKGSISRIRASDHEDGFVTLDLGQLVASQEMTVDNFFQFLTQENPDFDLDPVAGALTPLVDEGLIEVIRYRFLAAPPELSALPGAPGLCVEPEVYLRIGNFDFFEGDPDSALRWMQRGRAVLLPPIVAERLGVQVGDDIPVQTPRGQAAFTVAGIGGNGFMMTVLPYADAETYFGAATPSFLGIVVAEGQDVEAALARVENAIAPFPRMALMDYHDSLDPLLHMIDRLGLLLDALLMLAVVVAALGVVNTMVINVAERRREIGLLRAVGAAQRQVRQAVVAEAALLGLLAALVASGLGLTMLLTWGLLILPNGTTSLGVRPDWDTIRLTMGAGLRDWGLAALISLVFGPLVAALAAYFPARQAAAMDVVEATRSERVTLRKSGRRRPEVRRTWAWTMVWRYLTAHPLRSALTATAIALGVGMVLAAAIIGQAASRSADEFAQESPRVDLEILARDSTPFDTAILETLRAFPEIEIASPSLHAKATMIVPQIPSLVLLGVEPGPYQALHEPELAGGAFLDGPDSIVLPLDIALRHGLHTGDEITLAVGDLALTLTVAGRLNVEPGSLPTGLAPVAYVPLEVAQTLVGASEQIDRIELALRPGSDIGQTQTTLATQLGQDLIVVRAEVASGGAGFNTLFIQGGLAMVGLMILFAAGFVILNAFAMTVTGRTREIGALRALGMTRRQVMRTVLLEAGLLGLMGAAAGVLIGLGLAWGVKRAMGLLEDVPFVVPWWGLVLAPLIGLTVTLIGALQPAWRAGRVSPLEAIRAGTRETSGWYARSGGRAGALLLILLLPTLAAYGLVGRPDIWKAMAATGVGIAGLLAAAVLLLPALVGWVGNVCRVLLSRRFAAGRLAADNLRRNRQRAALTAGAMVAGLTMIVATSGLWTLFLEGSIANIGTAMHEDIVLTADLMQMMTSGEISLDNIYQSMTKLTIDPAVTDALAPLTQTGVVKLQRVGIAPIPSELITVPTGRQSAGMFVDLDVFIAIGNFDFYQGDPDTALDWAQRGPVVLLQPLAAERLGVGVGDTIAIDTPRGEVAFTVAGIGGSALFSPIFSYTDGEAYFELAGLFQLGIVVSEGQDVDTVMARVQEYVRPFPGVAVMKDVGGIIDEAAGMFDRFQALLDALLLLAVIVAGLGVVNTMVINVTERGREIGLLRAVGATQRQVRRMIVAEAAALGLMAALTAIVLGLLMVLVYAMVVMPNGWGALGMRADWATIRGQLIAALTDMGLAAALAVIAGPAVAALAAYFPARQAAAMDVVEATRSERVTLRRGAYSAWRKQRPTRHKHHAIRNTPYGLAWRNMQQSRTRTALSVLAVALGVAMTVAADLTSSAILNALAKSKDAQIFMTGLLDQLDRMLVLVGVMISIAAGFLVFNAFAMSITQRRRQIGALRALGMTRRQVLRLVLAEALLTGGAGTLLGLVGGPVLGRGTIALMKTMLGEGIFVFAAGSVSPSILLLAAGLGMGITLLSVLIPARRAARVSPLTALRAETASGIERNPVGRLLLGLLVAVLLFAYLAVAPPGEWVSPPWDTGLTVLLVALWLGCLALILPALIGGVGRWARRPLARFWGAAGRLTADNVQRGRGRVTLTALTLAVALTMIASLTGFFQFVMHELFWSKMELIGAQGALGLAPIDIMAGMSAYSDLESMAIPPEALAAVRQTAAGRAQVIEFHFVIVPELSFFGNSYFSFIVEPDELRQSGRFAFQFIEGDWPTALSIMDAGCGALVMPLVAGKNGVSVGETIQVSGAEGPLACTVAGIGESFVGASIVSSASAAAFRVTDTSIAAIIPLPGEDREALKADLSAAVDGFQNAELMEIENLTKLQLEVIDALPGMFNALLLLAILAAALGVVNTTVMSVAERRRELGLLRAVGATRRQVSRVVTGEAALMGLVGGGLGLVAGAGVTVILVVTYGGNGWGVPDLDLWPAAWRSVQPVLLNGLLGLIAAPFVCAGAAWLPGRRILRGSAVETLEGERQMQNTKADHASWQRGSIRARFVLGTAALVLVLLLGLIAAVTAHERGYLEDWMRQTLAMMVEGQAGFIEMNLPGDTRSLTLADLELGEFDADALLRFRALMDDMSAFGLQELAVTDGDNVVLLGLDPRQIGSLLPALETPDETAIVSEREAGVWQMRAAAPVRNDAGQTLGSVRVTVSLAEMQGLLDKTRNALWAAGGIAAALALALSWWLTAPLASATAGLTAQAARVAGGEYAPVARRRGRWAWLAERTSLRLRLTAALVGIVVLLVGVLEVVTVPIQRRHVEGELKEGMVAAAEWLGQVTSEGLDAGLLPEDSFSLEKLFELAGTTDWADLQELTEKTRSEDMAYVALVDRDGVIQFSDQFSLIGETAAIPAATQVEEIRWQDEEIWAISTPLRGGQDGEPVGALQMGLRRAGVEDFLAESRTLFRLSGLIALLAGVLLAQAVGGAVTAPVREMAAGVRRVGQGDLSVRFRADTRDELSLLAAAFNQMVTGLREREWLRDMFGRFVSREVAEAIRSGQVRLEGENRVVSVLFCDIRGFTTRSEKSTPAEVVALLNEYLPVVVEAAQSHAGTVNKFGGDSTLIIYGAPKALQESAYQAVLTALQMRANLAQLNERLASRGEEPIRIGVGINTGVVLAGAVGPRERQEYTVIGDAVNLASRIEALNKQYPQHDVLISEWTHQALGSRRSEFVFEDLGAQPIRGKAEPVRVLAVVGRSG